MSPQVTFKSNDERRPTAGSLVDSGGREVLPAPRLADAVRTPVPPSHGRAPSNWPPTATGLVDLGTAAALRVTGPDRETWLQGMQTNDVAAAPFGGAVPAAFLAGKGRLVAEGLVWRFPEELIVAVDAERLDALHAHLDRLLIMEDCELARAAGLWRLRWMPGEVAPAEAPADVVGAPGPLGLELLLDEARARALLALLPVPPGPAQVEAWRVALGVPAWGRELDEEVTPIEAGLDRMLSFDKGCYVGQEVVAMATYRGRVSWNLVRLEADGPAPAPGARLGEKTASGKRGRVTSSAQAGGKALLLGYVPKDLIVPGSRVSLEDGRAAEVLGLPFGSRPGAGVCT